MTNKGLFESRRDTYIGLAPGAPTPPPIETIFADGFESGNLSAWSYNTNDGGDLSATTGSALTGTYGMAALLDDNNSIYFEDWKPYEDTQHRQRFYCDSNTITMANNDAHHLFYAMDREGTVVERIELQRYNSTYQVRSQAVNDSTGWNYSTSWVTISDAPHYLEIYWRAATAPGANNGGLTFWIDGVQQDNFATVDNDTRRVEYVQLGPLSGIDNGTRGTLYFDAFESRRNTYIGPVAGLLSGYRMVDLPSWDEIRSWGVSVLVPDAPAQGGDARLAPQAFQHDPDLLLR